MNKKAQQILIMGVSGSGKTSVGKALAQALACDFIDADDFHSPESKAMMAAGTPLTDKEREPWLLSLCEMLSQYSAKRQSVVLAVSGLKSAHRIQLTAACKNCESFLLDLPFDVLEARLTQRASHFFPATLLKSQLSSLEQPKASESLTVLDGNQTITALVDLCKLQLTQSI